jgi:hypothetical protein
MVTYHVLLVSECATGNKQTSTVCCDYGRQPPCCLLHTPEAASATEGPATAFVVIAHSFCLQCMYKHRSCCLGPPQLLRQELHHSCMGGSRQSSYRDAAMQGLAVQRDQCLAVQVKLQQLPSTSQ